MIMKGFDNVLIGSGDMLCVEEGVCRGGGVVGGRYMN